MTKDKAIAGAVEIAAINEVEISVVHDPLGRDPWQTEEEAYHYAPTAAWQTFFRFGERIATVSPDGTVTNLK